eukprot:TRINITY_DN3133_c0_g2_i2.p1 TRINITY_DN3133_c0_g2~~TRINITY_DN3133_c0_g2_i2.p1  ORF type:complete len:623 (-),score=188.38 TRINITY_DN3133_c0_g2_i2:1568-3436(-)
MTTNDTLVPPGTICSFCGLSYDMYSEISSQKQEIQKLNEKIREYEETSIDEMKIRIRNLESDLKISNDQFNLQYKAFHKLEDDNENLSKMMYESQVRHKEVVESLQLKIENLTEQLETIRSSRNSLIGKVNELQNNKTSLRKMQEDIVVLRTRSSSVLQQEFSMFSNYLRKVSDNILPRITKLEKRNSNLIEKLEFTQHEYRMLNTRHESTHYQTVAFENKLVQKDKTIEELRLQLTRSKSMVERLQDEIAAKEEELGSYKNNSDFMIVTKDKTIQKLERKVIDQTEEMTARFVDLKQRLRDTSKQLIAVKNENVDLQVNVTGLKTQIEQLKSANQENVSCEILILQQKNRKLSERLRDATTARLKSADEHRLLMNKYEGEIEEHINHWKERYSKLKDETNAEIQEQAKLYNILEKETSEEINHLKTQLSIIKSSKHQNIQQNEETKSKIDRLTENLRKADAKILTYKTKSENLEMDLYKQFKIIEKLENEISDLKVEMIAVEVISSEKENLQNTIEQKERFIEQKNTETTDTLQIFQESLADLKSLIAKKDEELFNLKEKYKKEAAQKQQLTSELLFLRKQVESLSMNMDLQTIPAPPPVSNNSKNISRTLSKNKKTFKIN